jgi:hypothetical protein
MNKEMEELIIAESPDTMIPPPPEQVAKLLRRR